MSNPGVGPAQSAPWGGPVDALATPDRRRSAPTRRWRVARGAALVLAAGLAAPATAARIERIQAALELPPGRSVVSPYVEPRSGALVVHVQPLQANQSERLVDARSGRPWDGELGALLRDFSHLGSERVPDLATATAPDLAWLHAMGCTAAHVLCTSLQDADVVLLGAPAGRGGLALTVLDARRTLTEMEDLLAGRIDAPDWGDDEWRAIEVVSRQPERRSRWLAAVRSIAGVDEFQRLAAAIAGPPRLGARPMFQDAQGVMDLRAELELVGHKLLVGAHAARLLDGGGAASLGALADALESATKPPNQIGVATHLVDLLGAQPEPQRRRLADELAAEAGRRRSEVLRCFSQWLSQRACGDGAPPWVAREPAAEAGSAGRVATPAPSTRPQRPSPSVAPAATRRTSGR